MIDVSIFLIIMLTPQCI